LRLYRAGIITNHFRRQVSRRPFPLPAAPWPADNGAVPADHDPSGKVMKFTGACVYALRALVYLARHKGSGLVATHTIAAAEGLSQSFLGKALTALARSGVLRADRGPSGGFRLARPARDVTLLEVVETIDGPIRGLAPRFAGDDARLHARLHAKLQAVCDGAAEAVRRRLRTVSLADLAGEGE
jgi:Rrf2 family protein